MPALTMSEVKILLALLAKSEGNNMSMKNDELAEIIGEGSSADAMRQRVRKLKLKARECLEGKEVTIR